MRIVHGLDSLSRPGGIPNYVATISDALQRDGHEVSCYANQIGSGTDMLDASGIPWFGRLDELPGKIDVLFVHDGPTSYALLERLPDVPQIFFWHGSFFDSNTNPQISGACERIVALWPQCARRISAMAVRPPVISLTQPVDLTRFRPQRPLSERPARAIALSNWMGGEQLRQLETACERAGLEFRLIGSGGEGVTNRPQDAINEADIVFGKGRVIVEAMACGRAAYVFDTFGADGWVTPDSYERLADVNFCGSGEATHPSVDELVSQLREYSSSMGPANVAMAQKNHHAHHHVAELVKACEEILGASADRPQIDDPYELARLSRVAWRHESESFHLHSRLVSESLRRGDAEWELEQARAEAARLESELDAIRRSPSWRITAPLRAIKRFGR